MNQNQEKMAAIILAAKATKQAGRHSAPETVPIHAAGILWAAFQIVAKEQGLTEWKGIDLE